VVTQNPALIAQVITGRFFGDERLCHVTEFACGVWQWGTPCYCSIHILGADHAVKLFLSRGLRWCNLTTKFLHSSLVIIE